MNIVVLVLTIVKKVNCSGMGINGSHLKNGPQNIPSDVCFEREKIKKIIARSVLGAKLIR